MDKLNIFMIMMGIKYFFSTVDTVLYFDFNENCSPNLKTFFFDTIANSIIKIDTIEDYRRA